MDGGGAGHVICKLVLHVQGEVMKCAGRTRMLIASAASSSVAKGKEGREKRRKTDREGPTRPPRLAERREQVDGALEDASKVLDFSHITHSLNHVRTTSTKGWTWTRVANEGKHFFLSILVLHFVLVN